MAWLEMAVQVNGVVQGAGVHGVLDSVTTS
jgi:hypothetical protein